jgi:hypothetical protein
MSKFNTLLHGFSSVQHTMHECRCFNSCFHCFCQPPNLRQFWMAVPMIAFKLVYVCNCRSSELNTLHVVLLYAVQMQGAVHPQAHGSVQQAAAAAAAAAEAGPFGRQEHRVSVTLPPVLLCGTVIPWFLKPLHICLLLQVSYHVCK